MAKRGLLYVKRESLKTYTYTYTYTYCKYRCLNTCTYTYCKGTLNNDDKNRVSKDIYVYI